ncbi:MAG: T9SS type A sorting domain-containing protein [Bacteroidales bacterium]|nr:T9SS type A sorting domain-containing protein [Bacteroidales bacterium]
MKKRFLPISLTATLLSFSFLFFSLLSMAGHPDNPDTRKFGGSWLESVRANQHTGMVNPLDVFNAGQQTEALRVKSTYGAIGLDWLSLGPDNYPGMTWSAIFDNTDPTGLTILAGAANGGVWKSINLGLTWMQMSVENNVIQKVSSLVQASNGTIYAATGVTTCKTVNYSGNGIYRYFGGGPFSVIPATQSNPDFKGVTKIAIAPHSGRLYAATIGGLYYSDNGDDWMKSKSGYATDVCVGSDGTVLAAVGDSAYIAVEGNLNSWVTLTTGMPDALPTGGFGWMVFAIAPSDANVMYASLAGVDGKLLNVYSSTNKGATWSIVFPNNPTFEPYGVGNGCYSNTLAVFPNDPYKLFLGGLNMWYGERILSTGFYNWEKMSFGTFGAYSPSYAPLYHHCYTFRPNNANQVVMATDGGVSIASIGANGVTFQTSNKNLQTSQFNTVSFSAQRGYAMGGGDRIGTLALGYFSPSQVSFSTNGYQIWRQDASSLPAAFQPQPANYAGNGGSCEWSSIDSRVAIYSQEGNVKIRRQDFTDINYYNLFSKGVNAIATSTDRIPMRLWETFNQGQVMGITRDSVKYFADPNPIPADTTIMIRSACNNFLFPYHTTAPIPKGDSIIVADPIASRFFLYGDSLNVAKGIFMTMDALKLNKVATYYLIFKNLDLTDHVSTLAISADLNTLWAGTYKGRLIRISGIINAYDSATANIASSQCVLVDSVFTNTPFAGRTVSSISINPNNSNMVLIALGNSGNQDYVYYTQNGNDPAPLFKSVQSNLPKTPVYSGLLEMTDNNTAIVGTDFGIFTTTNLGSATPQWAADIQNIGDVAVMDIRQQVMKDYHILNTGVIYVATYGRGLWMETSHATVGIDPVQGELRTINGLKLSPNPVKDNLNISYVNEKSGRLDLSVYDLTGRMLINYTLGNQPKGNVITIVNLSGLSSGTYIVKVGNGFGKVVKL